MGYRAATTTTISSGNGGGGDLGMGEMVQNSRSDALIVNKERPQLQLLPRSVPLEPMSFEQQKSYDAEEDLRKRQARLEEKRQRQRDMEAKKKQVLEQAFASDDDEEEEKEEDSSSNSGSESEEEQDATYIGNKEE